MRKRSGVVILCVPEKRILLIYRKKKSKRYYVIPGGDLAENESFEDAAKRELEEELGLSVQNIRELCTIHLTNSIEKYYVSYLNNCEVFHIQGEEFLRSNVDNVYNPTWVDISELPLLNLLPHELKSELISFLSTND